MMPALYTGAAGMNASARALNATAHNMANVQTVGYKTQRTYFADLMTTAVGFEPLGSQQGHGVYVESFQNMMDQGALVSTEQATDAAINGQGFFKVLDASGTTDQYYYTRAGQFHFNADQILVNEEGYHVQGFNVDAGTISATAGDIDISGRYDAGQVTTGVDVSVNLDSLAELPTAAFDPTDESTYNYSTMVTVFDSNGLARSLSMYFRRGSATGQYQQAALTTAFGADNDLTFTAVDYGGEGQNISLTYLDPGAANQPLSVSVSGDAITVSLATDAGGTITSTGADVLAALNGDASASALITTSLASATGTGLVPAMAASNLTGVTEGGYWDYHVYISASDAAGGVATQGAAGYLSFDSDGQLNEAQSAQTVNGFDFADGATPGQAIAFDFSPGTGGITTTTQLYGASAVYYLYQDGYAQGELQGVAIQDEGQVYGYFSNGRSEVLAYLAVAGFDAPQELERVGENLWAATTAAGTETVDRSGLNGLGVIAGGKLESSTTDLATEMVNLIDFQRAYQVNSRSITTSDQMLQTAINMKQR
jgi:flagellar hook protein FlgE